MGKGVWAAREVGSGKGEGEEVGAGPLRELETGWLPGWVLDQFPGQARQASDETP